MGNSSIDVFHQSICGAPMALNLEDYSLTFSDEFTGSYLNTSVWGTKYWWGGRTLASNAEMQYFADRSTAVIQQKPTFRSVPHQGRSP
jgi:hypothetical protein